MTADDAPLEYARRGELQATRLLRHPAVLQHLEGGVALVRVAHQHVTYEVLGVAAHRAPLVLRERELAVLYLVEQHVLQANSKDTHECKHSRTKASADDMVQYYCTKFFW